MGGVSLPRIKALKPPGSGFWKRFVGLLLQTAQNPPFPEQPQKSAATCLSAACDI
jgi:hypothetical protein